MDSDVVRMRLELDVDVAHSSLSDDDSDEDHDEVLLPPGLVPSPFVLMVAVAAHWWGECGEHDRLINTKAALHSFIWSSPLRPRNISPSCEYDGRRLRELLKLNEQNNDLLDLLII